jgi:hypothetical protein
MKYQLLLSQDALRILSDALIEMPFRVVAPLISDINSQIAAQIKEGGDVPPYP